MLYGPYLPYFGSEFVKHGPFWSISVLFGHFSPVWSMIDRQSRSVCVSFDPLRPITAYFGHFVSNLVKFGPFSHFNPIWSKTIHFGHFGRPKYHLQNLKSLTWFEFSLYLDEFHLRWLNVQGIDVAFSIWIVLFTKHLN